MIALRTIDESLCRFDISIEAFRLSLNANDRCFGCPSGYPLEPPGHTPPAFLFLSSTMSNSGKSLVTLQSMQSTRLAAGPLSGRPATASQCISNSDEVSCAASAARPSVVVLI